MELGYGVELGYEGGGGVTDTSAGYEGTGGARVGEGE